LGQNGWFCIRYASLMKASILTEDVRGALHTIDENEEFIKLTLAVLMAPD